MSLLSSFFRLAAPLPRPHLNPVTGGHHWFHGTGHEFYDDGDPEVPADPGGTLRPPDREAYEYGQHAGEHWNTDLGVHFTSKQRTAEAFATGTGSHAIRPHENSRIAHAKLHMANPKHYDSEHDMAHEAIEWAHKHGHHYLEGSARHEDEWEDHLDQGGYYSEIPDHDHLEYVDAHTTGAQQRRSIDVIDRHHGLEDASGPEKDRYLALHPHREEITSGFKEHLRSQGHDGITYGNEYEPPHGHTCAIPFDHDQINLTHWQWLDPRREHMNRHQEGKEPQPEQKERLFDRNYTPEHGYHWSDQEGKKIGLLQHFASDEHHPLSHDELAEHLQQAFHPQQLEAREEKHPKSGWNVDVGEQRRLDHVADDVPDYAGDTKPLSEWSAPARLRVRDFGSDVAHRPMLPKDLGHEPLQHVYRGVSMEEYHQARERGHLQSDLRGVLSEHEGTNAAVDPRTAISYLPPGQHGMVLKIKARPEHDWRMIRADNYVRTAKPIPMSDVEHAEPYSKSKRWQVYAGHVPDHVLNDQHDWQKEASGTPLYRQPKPEYQSAPEDASDDEVLANGDQQRQRQSRWTHEVRRALSRGDLHPQEAWNNGYKGMGHDRSHEEFRRSHEHNLGWEHLPQTVWHVTTNKAGVLAHGSLKSRAELGQVGGHGLGGGEDDTISVTDDPEMARHIHRALHEYHAVLNGKTTPSDLMQQAHAGGFEKHMVYSHGGPHPDTGEWQHGHPYPQGLQDVVDGTRTHMGTHTHEEARAEYGPEAQPVPGAKSPVDFPDGKERHYLWKRPATPEEKMGDRSEFYKRFATWRESTGGHPNPGFIMNDVKGMASCHPSQFGIVRLHPKPGARGYRVSALGEWRSADGSSLHIGGLESPHQPTEGPQHTALRVVAKQAKQDSSGYLPNPYREDTDEWFHGSRHRPGDGEFDDLDPVAMREGHRPPGNGAGGPQMNKLLGVHLSALHDVAHGFADASSDHGKIFHVRLRMKNPIHFEDESSLLRHVWNSTMRDDHFHDEHHDKSLMEWNYGAGATREGINRRLDRAKTAEPGSLARRGPHSSMESYLQFHPRQKEIAEAYVHHLRDEGHDGITYGNNVEGPRLHHCAIAFDKQQIKTVHVDRMHPSGLDDQVEKQRKYQWMPTVSHDHIRSIHGEPEDFLHEVERYHSGGTLRAEPGHSYFGPNTGRGDFKFHQGAQEHPDKGDFGTHVTLKDMGITDVGDIARHPESESMESYGIHWGKDHIAANDYDPDQFDSFHTETVDEPLSNIRYKEGQSHVIHPYVEHLAQVPAHELEPAWAQRMPDGTALLMEGHHRAAAASLRGDTTLKTTVYGKWGPGEREAGHARWKQQHGKTSALLPGYVKEHPWLPEGRGIFMPDKGSLDPRLFGRNDQMRPRVKQEIMGRLAMVLAGQYPDWEKWARVALAGSEASRWWGGNDFDTMFGIHYGKFRKAHPEDADLTNDQISAKVTGIFRRGFNDEHWTAPWDGQEWHLTCYSNPDAYDIRKIKPYAAYDMTHDKWVVKSPHVGKDWGPQKWDESIWEQGEAYLALVDAIAKMKDPVDQARRGSEVYQYLHNDRRHAFSKEGQGWKDPSNVLWKFMEYHPSAPVEKLVNWAHLHHARTAVGGTV